MRIVGLVSLLSVGIVCSACAETAEQPKPIRSFEECVASGRPILRTLPARCVSADGLVFLDLKRGASKGAGLLCVDLCGNGTCEEIVCTAEGCPCAETPASCPADCKEGK